MFILLHNEDIYNIPWKGCNSIIIKLDNKKDKTLFPRGQPYTFVQTSIRIHIINSLLQYYIKQQKIYSHIILSWTSFNKIFSLKYCKNLVMWGHHYKKKKKHFHFPKSESETKRKKSTFFYSHILNTTWLKRPATN